MCECLNLHVCVYGPFKSVVLRGQLAGINALLPPCESQGPNSGHTACWQAPLPMSLFLSLEEVMMIKITMYSCTRDALVCAVLAALQLIRGVIMWALRGLFGAGVNHPWGGLPESKVQSQGQPCNSNTYVLINPFSSNNPLCQIPELTPVHTWGC